MKINDCIDNLNSVWSSNRVLIHNLLFSHLKKERLTSAIVSKQKTNFVGLYSNLTLFLPRILSTRPSPIEKKEMCEVGELAL